MSDVDPHAPMHAGPEPVADGPEPTPVVGAADATWSAPAGSAAGPGAAPIDEHPEKKVGAAFAGGLVAAIVLKSLAKRRQR